MNQGEKISLTYISTGCNKSPQAMDWGENNLVCFGACNSVAIYDPHLGKIVTTFSKHKETVTCVRWVRRTQNGKHQLISGSADSSLILWTFDYNNKCINSTYFELLGHKNTILAVDGMCRGDNSDIIIVSASSDHSFRFWHSTGVDCGIVCLKVVDTFNFIFSLNMLFIPDNNSVLVALGTDTPDLLLYSFQESDVTFLTKISGHEDWIRSIDMIILPNGDILMASSSQDQMIRILKLSMKNSDHSAGPFFLENEEILIGNVKYFLTLETVLVGHDGWVFSVNWFLSSEQNIPLLLSASFDRTIIIWKPCPDSGVWLEESRMGEMGGDNTLGYYGAKFGCDGSSVLAHSYQGAFHFWKKRDSKWIAEYVPGGHLDAVTDIAWEMKGRYIISVSADKTTRIHSPCLKGMPFENSIWCEVSRPQIHGHALYSVASLNGLGFASCSEEKVVRAFLPTYTVLKVLKHFCDPLFNNESEDNMCLLPSSASITALGLSNKANVIGSEENVENKEIIRREISDNMSLNEDYLVQNTLWPEVMKLYGHGNDVFCLSSSNDGKILATAAKATTPDQAKIILWDTEQWEMIQKLDGHQLTVTQMAFSPDGSYLLSVSRDRKWCLFKKCENGLYSLSLTPRKGRVSHSRIVWSCSWSHDGKYFVTGSRDCKVIIWELDNPVSVLTSDYGSVTAVSFGSTFIETDKYIVAIGHESGHISIYKWLFDNWTVFSHFSTDLNHHLTVQRLLFQPITPDQVEGKNNSSLCLASCSADYSVRLYSIFI